MSTKQEKMAERFRERLAGLEAENRALREQLGAAEAAGDDAGRLPGLEAENRRLGEQVLQLQRLAAMGTMTAMIAHEFNNILTPAISYAELARKDPGMTDKSIARTIDCGRRATDICSAILGIAGQGAPEAVRLDVSRLITETLLAMGRDPKRDGIDMVFRAPADLTMVTRKVELQQVLLNLLLNARTAVLKRGGPRRIEVVAERCGDDVVIRVVDNGVGIDPGNLRKVFEPFFTTRSDTDGRRAGHGLGLAICREIVASLGGEIAVESEPGRGTTFTVSLAA